MSRPQPSSEPTIDAERFARAAPTEQAALLHSLATSQATTLAARLRDCYAAAVGREPALAAAAATAAAALARALPSPLTEGYAAWIAGLASLQLEGQVEAGIHALEQAIAVFVAGAHHHEAAAATVGLVFALALAGRYDEAERRGLAARDTMLKLGDPAGAGRIEQNLGNLYGRRDHYEQAEALLRSARSRFLSAGDDAQRTQTENSLALMLMYQARFDEAAALWQDALAHAGTAAEATRAEIERNLGQLHLLQGRSDQALALLESARRRFAALDLPHRTAGLDHELADAYLELHLLPEAAALYQRVLPVFAELGLRSEQAAAAAQYGRLLAQLQRGDEARTALQLAHDVYQAEANSVGAAVVDLSRAEVYLRSGDAAAAGALLTNAEAVLAAGSRWLLPARLLRAEAARDCGDIDLASRLLVETEDAAERVHLPWVAERCATLLGLLARAAGDADTTERCFRRAIEHIERLRAPLPGEEFRIAFFAGRQTAYEEMARLCLSAGAAREREALVWLEAARARTLLETPERGLASAAAGPADGSGAVPDGDMAVLRRRLQQLRGALNWLYSRLEDAPLTSGGEQKRLSELISAREEEYAAVRRSLTHAGGGSAGARVGLDVTALQAALSPGAVLIAYWFDGGALVAFVVTRQGVRVHRLAVEEAEVMAELQRFNFQISALRGGAERVRRHLPQLEARARAHLARLYDLVLRPLAAEVAAAERLMIVPHRALHYLPFHALHDGDAYLIERLEVTVSPSATLGMQPSPPRPSRGRAVVAAVAGETLAHVHEEARAVAACLPAVDLLLDAEATRAALAEKAAGADVVHLACHARFRPDNPLFSALRLGDGWLTVQEAAALDLRGALVTLSACETGVSAVAPGDELLGLVRGFLQAQAGALVLSLWRVDDQHTAALMSAFYAALQAGISPASALAEAQRTLLKTAHHPFFWAPFTVIAR